MRAERARVADEAEGMVTSMTRDEYMACVRDLTAEVDAAQERRDEDGRLGAVMALDAFLSVVRPPPVDRCDHGSPACDECVDHDTMLHMST